MTCTLSPIRSSEVGADRDDGVLGGQSGDRTVRIVPQDRRGLVLTDGFLADVEDRAVGGGSADDRGQDGDGRSVALDVADLGIVLAGEDPSAGLELGDSGEIGGVLIAARSAGRDDPARHAGGLHGVAGLEQPADRRGDRRALLGRIRNEQSVPFVTHQPVESQARGRRDEPCQVNGGLGRRDAGALHPEVDVHEHADRDPLRDRRPAHRGDLVFMIDGRLDVGVVLEGRQPGGLARADDQVCDQDVVDPRGGHDLGLGDLGHRDPDGARTPEKMGDRRALERLGVRTPGHSALSKVTGHPIDIVLQRSRSIRRAGVSSSATGRPIGLSCIGHLSRGAGGEGRSETTSQQGARLAKRTRKFKRRRTLLVRDFRWHSGGGDANVNGADCPDPRAISSAVRALLYTQDVGGSSPSSPIPRRCCDEYVVSWIAAPTGRPHGDRTQRYPNGAGVSSAVVLGTGRDVSGRDGGRAEETPGVGTTASARNCGNRRTALVILRMRSGCERLMNFVRIGQSSREVARR